MKGKARRNSKNRKVNKERYGEDTGKKWQEKYCQPVTSLSLLDFLFGIRQIHWVPVASHISQKEWKPFFRSAASGIPECFWSAEMKPNVSQLQQHAVPPEFLSISLISLLKSHLFKKPLKQLDTFAFSSQNFTASQISLNTFGVLWNTIFVSTAITHMLVCRRICPRHLHQWTFPPFGSGSTEWSDGWKLTEVVKMLRMLHY